MATRRRRAGQARVQADMNRVLYGGGERLARASTVQGEAKRQTRADKQDFKKNRAAGDRDMTERALELGSNYHDGGAKNIQTPEGRPKMIKRKLVEDSSPALKSQKPDMPNNETHIAKHHAYRDEKKKNKQEMIEEAKKRQQEMDEAERLRQEEALKEYAKRKGVNT